MIILGASFVAVTTDTETGMVTQSTFNELYYHGIVVSLYVCMAVSLFYYYLIKKGLFQPRWWTNLLLILFGYSLIPVTGIMLKEGEKVVNATTNIGEQFAYILILSIIGFTAISLTTKKKSEPVAPHLR